MISSSGGPCFRRSESPNSIVAASPMSKTKPESWTLLCGHLIGQSSRQIHQFPPSEVFWPSDSSKAVRKPNFRLSRETRLAQHTYSGKAGALATDLQPRSMSKESLQGTATSQRASEICFRPKGEAESGAISGDFTDRIDARGTVWHASDWSK